MKTESKQSMKKEKLEVFGILKEALTIPYRNPNFIIFIIIVSLPLFCFLIYFESFLLSILVETSQMTVHNFDNYYAYNSLIPDNLPSNLNNGFAYKLFQLCLLYLVPFHLLNLFTMVVTIDLSSKIYKQEEEERKMTLKEMIHKPITSLRRTFITSIYVLSLSTCTLLGLIWLVMNYLLTLRIFIYDVVFAVLFGGAFLALLMKHLEWSAMWNMSIVISILEERNGVEALTVSAYFNRGCEKRGRLLMFVFFVWGLCLRLLCLFLGGHDDQRENAMFVLVLLSSLGNVMKWVACMVYFYDCKNRILEKKVDQEVGV